MLETFYEPISERYFKSDDYGIRYAEDRLNKMLNITLSVNLIELYVFLGLSPNLLIFDYCHGWRRLDTESIHIGVITRSGPNGVFKGLIYNPEPMILF